MITKLRRALRRRNALAELESIRQAQVDRNRRLAALIAALDTAAEEVRQSLDSTDEFATLMLAERVEQDPSANETSILRQRVAESLVRHYLDMHAFKRPAVSARLLFDRNPTDAVQRHIDIILRTEDWVGDNRTYIALERQMRARREMSSERPLLTSGEDRLGRTVRYVRPADSPSDTVVRSDFTSFATAPNRAAEAIAPSSLGSEVVDTRRLEAVPQVSNVLHEIFNWLGPPPESTPQAKSDTPNHPATAR